MNYQEARAYIEEITGRRSIVLGVEAMTELMHRLGDPQDDLKFVHVAGTNGKGSVIAFVSTILSEAGYRTGRYISPTLFAYRERIQINGEMIEKEAFARLMTQVKEVCCQMEEDHIPLPTAFEQETAVAFLYFLEQKCELVVLETGMGGLTDATNVVKTTILEIIAAIGMDHMGFLGNTIAEIAEKKAGIIKPGTKVVSAFQEKEAAEVIENTCQNTGSTLSIVAPEQIEVLQYGFEQQHFSYKDWKNVTISLAGSYQIPNAALALEAIQQLKKLGFPVTEEHLYCGMANTRWKGRFTVMHRDPLLFVDGAHNPHAAKVLKESLELYFSGKRLIYIMGVFSDKDYQQVIQLTAPLASHIYTIQTPGNPRALPAETLKEAILPINPSVEACSNICEAVEKSLNFTEKEDIIIAFGSLSYLSEVEKALNILK